MSRFYNLEQAPFNNRALARSIVASNNGLIYNIQDLSTLFQDAAGTVPVTAVGQPVGKILDKSGNGNHATQSVTASRPTLIYENGLYGLQFDGIDDYLNLPYMGLYAGGVASVVVGLILNDVAGVYSRLLAETSSVLAAPRYIPFREGLNSPELDISVGNDAGTVLIDSPSLPLSSGVPTVVTFVDTGSKYSLYKNGVLGVSGNYLRSGSMTLDSLTIGAQKVPGGGYNAFSASAFNGLIITKSSLTDIQRIRCERLLARKAGVKL